jgi:hypothetical protein
MPDVLYGVLIGDHVIHAKPKENQETHAKETFLDLAGEPVFSYMQSFCFWSMKIHNNASCLTCLDSSVITGSNFTSNIEIEKPIKVNER